MPKKIDLTGQKFGKLTALSPAPKVSNRTRWLCRCECGKEIIVDTADLRRGHTQSCGCYKAQRVSESSLIDYAGQRFGYLEVIERDMQYQGKGVPTHWFCKCHKCGNIKSISSQSLRSGAISCGCAKSRGEYKIMMLLQQYSINYITEFKFEDHKNRRYDFALINKQGQVVRLIEFDGLQHYHKPRAEHWASVQTLEEAQLRDKEKNEIAKSKGIGLVRIPYWHLDKLTITDLLSDKFLIK